MKLNKQWKFEEKFPSVSAYWTTFNCLKWGYPIEESLLSFGWVDELIVVDGGSTDGTLELLESLKEKLGGKLQVYEMPIDWEDPGKDGAQKALARSMTTCEFTIQVDADELCGNTELVWRKKMKSMPKNVDIMNLFVHEPFGDPNNFRMNESHNPLKWRIYRNNPAITHGIPKQDRLILDGKTYSKGMTDGCFPMNIVTEELCPSYTEEKLIDLVKSKDVEVKNPYVLRAINIMSEEPYVLHLGHVDLRVKMNNYLNNWHKWWCHLYNKDPQDPQNNLYFPGVRIEDVTEDMIESKIEELRKSTPCGWISGSLA
jgi:glycosyltransferase involved in cell wall biosynthesis